MNSEGLSAIPCSHRTRFTRRFLQALARIGKDRPTSSSPAEILQRSRRIKIAADASMASAVGSRRAWSRAILWRLRRRPKWRALIRPKVIGSKKKKRDVSYKGGRELIRANKLRPLVPGGEAMDLCNLLEETAHYIKCLTTQVQVMRSIADFYSN